MTSLANACRQFTFSMADQRDDDCRDMQQQVGAPLITSIPMWPHLQAMPTDRANSRDNFIQAAQKLQYFQELKGDQTESNRWHCTAQRQA